MIKLALVQKKDYGNGQVGEDQAVGRAQAHRKP